MNNHKAAAFPAPEEKTAEALITPTLIRDEQGRLCLSADGQSMYGDFSRLLPRTVPNNLNGELVVRAARPKKALADGHILTVLDATAGMGEDSFLLAAAGFHVTLYERDHTVFLLLEDALLRAAENPDTAEIISRMHAIEGDSTEAMQKIARGVGSPPCEQAVGQSSCHPAADGSSAQAEDAPAVLSIGEKAGSRPDVILLDPMFPERKKSGLVKKKFQLIHYLEAPCSDENVLFEAARAACPSRIVVKRPEKGPFLAETKPSYSLKGGSIRYDVYV